MSKARGAGTPLSFAGLISTSKGGRRARSSIRSSWWVPSSTIRPLSMTTIRSAFADGGQSVGDYQGRTTLQGVAKSFLDQQFRMAVYRGCSFVEDDYPGVSHQGPGQGNKLALAGAEVYASLLHLGVVPLLQARDEAIGPDRPFAASTTSSNRVSGWQYRILSLTVPEKRKGS